MGISGWHEDARNLFPAARKVAYFNTAATALGSTVLRDAYADCIADWTENGFDTTRGERAGENARAAFSRIIGASPEDVALIPSVSAAAGLIASQFDPAKPGENVVVGEREYSSNHFPWRLLERKDYDVRQTPFRNGGLEPEDIEERADGGTLLIAFSAVQNASGHRSDIAGIADIARRVGAMTFVDGSQMAGALPVAPHLDSMGRIRDRGPQVPAERGPGRGLLLCSQAGPGSNRADKCRMESRRRSSRELLRAGYAAFGDGFALRRIARVVVGYR